MFFLVVTVIFGALFAIFATQNTIGVPVTIGAYSWTNVPLYIIAIASLLFGLLVAWILSIADWATNSLALHGKNQQIRTVKNEADKNEARIHELEIENARLKEEITGEEKIHKAEKPNPLRTFINNTSH